MKRINPLTISTCTIFLLALTSQQSRGLTLAFTDADFTPAWQTTVLAAPTTTGHSVTSVVSAAPTGPSSPSGNYTDNTVASGSSGQIVEGFIFDSTMVFDPAGMFVISSIDYSVDMFRAGGAVGSFAIEQNGTYYLWGGLNGAQSGVWENQQASLGQGNFGRFFEVTGTGGANPDFSENGAPITLGMYASIAGFFNQNTGQTAFDQFGATINFTAVPEPGVMSVLLVSVLAICGVRRRRW